MAIVKRSNGLFIYFRPFKAEKVGVRMPHDVGKTEARRIELEILRACRTDDYRSLDSVSREVCVWMFENRRWESPEGLISATVMPVKELTLWKSVELFLKDEDIKNSPSRWRREISLSHLVDCFGKDRPVKDIWIPQLKQYRAERMAKGMKPGTVNREMSTLSKLFGVLIELQFAETNPCRLVRRLSERAGQRQAYVSFEDFNRIVDACGGWFKPIVQLAYYGGM